MLNITRIQNLSQEMHNCIQNCLECHSICLATVAHCLQMGGEHASPMHIGILLDCAEMCQTSANFMLRGSNLHGRTCGVCAEACERCAVDCERLGMGDSQMMACADLCRRCAESCRMMAGMAA
ncbi:MAG: four-helix bundle copper-binding protein [bacterium]|nr:four-helix bundle copper-binding protein [bacterium]